MARPIRAFHSSAVMSMLSEQARAQSTPIGPGIPKASAAAAQDVTSGCSRASDREAMRRTVASPEADAPTRCLRYCSCGLTWGMASRLIGMRAPSDRQRLPASTLEACRRAVGTTGNDLGNITTARAGLGQDIVTIVLRLYRQGDEATRAGCLDIIDSLTDANAYGVDEALAEER